MPRSRLLPLFFAFAFLASGAFYLGLQRDPYLRGSDAYYYALQADHWASTGEVKIPDSGFIHRVNGLVIRAGLSPETALRLWIAVSLLAMGCAVALLIGNLPEFHPWASSLVYFWILLSPTLAFTAVEFPKMFSAWLALPLWLVPLAVRKRAWPLAILLSFATVLLHRMAMPWAILFSIAVFLTRGKIQIRRFWLWPAMGVLMIAGAYAIFFQDRLHWLDVSRFSWEKLQPGVYTLLARERLPRALKFELIAAFGIFLACGMAFWRNALAPRRILLLPAALILPGLVPLGSAEIFGIGERYALSLVPIFLLGSLFLLGQTRRRAVSAPAIARVLALAAASGVVLLVSLRWRLEGSHPLAIDPPFARYEKAVDALRGREIPMLIAHKGFVFFYKHQLKREAFPYEPEAHWNRERIWRVVDGLSAEELNYFSGERCGWTSGMMAALPETDYFLIREDCWQALRGKITAEDDADLYERAWATAINPSQPRPKFLYAKHRNDAQDEFPAIAP